jgi:hypothetical protein
MSLELVISFMALILAFCSFFISYQEVRRCNEAIVAIVDCKTRYSWHVQKGNFTTFSVTIANRGIALHDIKMKLLFRIKKDNSLTDLFFNEHEKKEFVFERGMQNTFKIVVPEKKTNSFVNPNFDYIDLTKSNPCFVVYSTGYEVARFKIGNWPDRAKTWVNQKISILELKKYENTNDDKNESNDAEVGNSHLGHYPSFPKFRCTLLPKVESFLDWMKRQVNS